MVSRMIGNRVNIKNAMRYRKLIVIGLLVTAAVFFLLLFALSHWSIKSEDIPYVSKSGLKSTLGEISQDAGEVSLWQTETKELLIDTKTLNIRVKDLRTGTVWNSLYLGPEASETEKSPLLIKFLGKDSKIYEWSSYQYCVENKSFTLHRIEKGVSINFNFKETDSIRIDEYMPRKISLERFESIFLQGIEKGLKDGTVTEAKASKYKSALGLIYEKDEENGYYYNKFAGVPPVSAIHLLIELSKTVGYSREMLIRDSEEFEIDVEIKEPPNFDIVMQIVLEDDDLVVSIPSYEIKSGNDFYTLQNIVVLPNLGLVTSKEDREGYILVPDGSGALFKLNTYNGGYPDYRRPIYNNTYYDTLYEMSPFKEDITMPVFGMAYEHNKEWQGFMGIIEGGSQTGYIDVKLGTHTPEQGGNIYNKVYASFDTMQFSRVKIFGPYSDNEARYLASTGPIDFDCTIRYKFFEKDASYFKMASAYQAFLAEEYGLTKSYHNDPKLYLNVIGALSVQDRFLGIPYDKSLSMTTYRELNRILEDLRGYRLVLNYSGAFNNGQNASLLNKPEIAKANGKKTELHTLINDIHNHNNEIFLQADLLKVYREGNGFRESVHGVYGYHGKALRVYGYYLPIKRFARHTNAYYIVNPRYLSSVTDHFLEGTEDIENIYLGDMASASFCYADYNPNHMVDLYRSDGIVERNLEKLSKQKTLALENPKAEKIKYGKYAVNISRQSSDFGTMYLSIPFRQLVYNGFLEYTTLDVNMSAQGVDYYLLQAFEVGSIPKFTISSKTADLLKNTHFNGYYEIQYDYLKNDITSLYEAYTKGLQKIGSKEIIDHKILGDRVYETTYANGTKVITNYNNYEVVIDGKILSPLGYIIN